MCTEVQVVVCCYTHVMPTVSYLINWILHLNNATKSYYRCHAKQLLQIWHVIKKVHWITYYMIIINYFQLVLIKLCLKQNFIIAFLKINCTRRVRTVSIFSQFFLRHNCLWALQLHTHTQAHEKGATQYKSEEIESFNKFVCLAEWPFFSHVVQQGAIFYLYLSLQFSSARNGSNCFWHPIYWTVIKANNKL